MTFPALAAFAADHTVRRLTFRLYMHLQREALDINQARAVKVAELAHTLRMRPASVIESLNWLVQNGYLIEHARQSRRIRTFTLAWTRETRIPSVA